MDKLIVVGDVGSGKTSLIQSLTSGVAQLSHTPTQGVDKVVWRPNESFIGGEILGGLDIEDVDGFEIEVWDTTGRQCCWSIHQSLFTSTSLYLLVFNWLQPDCIDSTLQLLHLIHEKVGGCRVILISTRSEAAANGQQSLERVQQNLLTKISTWESSLTDVLVDEMNRLRELSPGHLFMQEITNLEDQMMNRLTVHPVVLSVDLQEGKGLADAIRRILTTVCEKKVDLPLNTTEDAPLTARDIVYEDVGLDVFANLSCLFHLHTTELELRLEAYKFWPKESGCKKPDPELVEEALEEIPIYGIIREVLFPLLWKEKLYTEEEVRHFLHMMINEGIITEIEDRVKLSDPRMVVLSLPGWPNLSVEKFYRLPLLSVSLTPKPGVNWSEHPFDGDLHVGLVYKFPTKTSAGLLQRVLAIFQRAVVGCSYKYNWDKGVLCKYKDEFTMHVYHNDKELLLACRGPWDNDTDLIKLMWLAMKPAVKSAASILSQYKGVIYEVDVEVKGHPLVVSPNKQSKSRSYRNSFWSCLCAYKNGCERLENGGCDLNLTLLFSSLTSSPSSATSSWTDAFFTDETIEQVLEIPATSGHDYNNSQSSQRSLGKRHAVTWSTNLTEEIDMEKKAYEESHQPHVVSDHAVRKQLRRLAKSLVAAVVTSAVATVLVQQQKLTAEQEPVVELVAGAVKAGWHGDTFNAVEQMNKLLDIVQGLTEKKPIEKKSRVCEIL